MTDTELIHALCDDLLPSEIARKLEMPIMAVIAAIRTRPRQVKRLGTEEIRRAVGDKPFTVAEVAELLDLEPSDIRSKLSRLRKSGGVRKVGEIRTVRGGMAPLWRLSDD